MVWEGQSILLNEKHIAPWLSADKPWGTYMLIAVNVIVFLVMCAFSGGAAFFAPGSQLLMDCGANWAPVTLSGQEWRLVTQGFLHIGVLHLLMNMYVLWLFGRICERLFGTTRYLIIYFLSDIGAALFSDFSCLRISEIVSAGSSGPICGILGAYFIFIYCNRAGFEPGPYMSMMRQFGEYALMIVVYGVFVHADHAAHLGGVLTGALLGFLLLPRVKGEKLARKQFYALSVVCLSLVSICFFETTAAVDSRSSIQLSRIQLLRGQKRTEEAIIALKDLVQQHPQNAEAFVLLGTCEFELGRSKAAIEDINTALRIDPKSEPALSMKAYYAFQEGDYDKCVEILALIPPNSPYHNINKSYFKSRIDGVNGHLERALDEAAAYPATADKAKMQIYSQAGMDTEADELADKILKSDTTNREALYVRLISSWRKLNYKEVMRLSKTIGDITPSDSQARSYVAFSYNVAANMDGDKNPDLLLTQYQSSIQKIDWTKAIDAYLENRISSSKLIALAEDRAQQTEAYAYVGLNLLAHHEPSQAKTYLSWVVQNGVSTFTEYSMAQFELKKLNSGSKSLVF